MYFFYPRDKQVLRLSRQKCFHVVNKSDIVTKITMKMIFLLAAPGSAQQRCLPGPKKIFREINLLVSYFVKQLLSRNFSQKA